MLRSAAKAKRFPIDPSDPLLAALLQSCPVILAINWVFQGMRGMQGKELGFRLGLVGVIATLVATVATGVGIGPVPGLLVGAVIGHSFNFTANGQPWVVARYCALWHRQPDAVDRFLAETIALLRALPWLDEAVLIGSIAVRGKVSGPRADLDLRLVFPPGAAAWWWTNLLLLRLRLKALVRFVPLDLYAYDEVGALRRFDQREPLGIILDRRGAIAREFAARTRVPLP